MTKRTSNQLQEENRTLKKSNKTLKKKTILHERENKTLKKKTILHERENKTLKKKTILHEREIARLRKSLEQKDKDLDLERSLWNSRKAEWDSGAGRDLHRIEVFDGIISDESSLHSATLQNIEVPVHLATCGGVRDGLRRDAAVLRRRI